MIQSDSFLPEDLSMARIRTVKPELFRHEDLYVAEKRTCLPLRLSFIGLFTVADREGRFKWRPNEIKLDVLPFDEGVDFSRVMDALVEHGFIVRYEVDGREYGCIPTFTEHQRINSHEADSTLPAPQCTEMHMHARALTPNAHVEGKGKEGKGKEGDVCSEREASSPTVISIPLVSGEERPITQADVAEWWKLFPAVDILQELRKMRAWCLANPSRRKTPKGILRFVTTWLSREQDKGHVPINPIQPARGANAAASSPPEHKFDWSHCEICQGDGRLHVRTKTTPDSEPAPDDPVVPFYKLSDPRRIVSLDAEYPSTEWRIVNFRCSCPAGKAKTIPQTWPRLKPPLCPMKAEDWPVAAGGVH